MNNNHSSFVSPRSENCNCYYVHQILPNGNTEQIGYSLNFIHLVELEASKASLDWLNINEDPIPDSVYKEAKSLVYEFLSHVDILLNEASPVTKMQPSPNVCYKKGSRIGRILGQIRESSKVTFMGYHFTDGKKLTAFCTIHDPEDFLNEDYIQIDESHLVKLENLTKDTIEKLKTTLYQ